MIKVEIEITPYIIKEVDASGCRKWQPGERVRYLIDQYHGLLTPGGVYTVLSRNEQDNGITLMETGAELDFWYDWRFEAAND